MRDVKLLLSSSDVGVLYTASQCLVVTLSSGVSVPVSLGEGGGVLCAAQSPGGAAGEFNIITR